MKFLPLSLSISGLFRKKEAGICRVKNSPDERHGWPIKSDASSTVDLRNLGKDSGLKRHSIITIVAPDLPFAFLFSYCETQRTFNPQVMPTNWHTPKTTTRWAYSTIKLLRKGGNRSSSLKILSYRLYPAMSSINKWKFCSFFTVFLKSKSVQNMGMETMPTNTMDTDKWWVPN